MSNVICDGCGCDGDGVDWIIEDDKPCVGHPEQPRSVFCSHPCFITWLDANIDELSNGGWQ